MAQAHIANVETTEAKILADHVLIFHDLTFCIECCERLASLLQSDPEARTLHRALWESALVTYARCFATGVRHGLTPDIYARLEGEPLLVHQYYIDMRNKHIAHSVNPFEQIQVGIILSPPASEQREVIGISNLAMRYMHPPAESIAQFLVLVHVARTAIRDFAKEIEARVLADCKQMPIEQLYAKATPRVTAPAPSAAGTPRQFGTAEPSREE